MDMHQLTRELHVKNDSKIVMLVADGLGGLPLEPGGQTELETANTPNLDALAKRGVCGSSIPVKPGITPGSGPGHLGLFGYDPLKYRHRPRRLGGHRHRLRARPQRRGHPRQLLHARRQRATSATAAPAASPAKKARRWPIKLRAVKIPGVEVFVEPVKEHRFVVVFRGEGLGGDVHDTDPQATGVPPLDPVPSNPASEKTAEVASEFIAQARKILAGQAEGQRPDAARLFRQPEACRATKRSTASRPPRSPSIPMYKGLARLVGMDIVGKAQTLAEQIDVLEAKLDELRFLLHPLQVHRQHRRGRQLRRPR